MKKSDFYYDLPPELIAQTPLQKRDSSRLLVLNRATGKREDTVFSDLDRFLKPGDCLVINDTRVLPARIYGTKLPTGAHVEFLLLRQIGQKVWECLAGPGRKAKPGDCFDFSQGLTGRVREVTPDGNRIVEFSCDDEFFSVLDRIGEMPLPPYIKEKLTDKERYQTVYSRELGSAAAPTAGLHFTKEMLSRLKEEGIRVANVTLHVGLGTFRPVKEEEITQHHMHTEHYCVTQEAADCINQTKKEGGRVICVGTTSCRTLESATDENGILHAGSNDTSIFIYPGYRFRCMDALITNFHLPESTLIMLVSAFAGYELTMETYREAVEKKYRFFSFGDAMLIL